MSVKPIPDGYHTLTPYLVVDDAKEAMAFYEKALNAERVFCMEDEGVVQHAEMKIGNSMIMLSQTNPQWGTRSPKGIEGMPFSLYVYVEDVDALYAQAIEAGGIAKPGGVQDQFYGDRSGGFEDPYGHCWYLATHKEDLTPEQIEERRKEWMAKMAEQCAGGEGSPPSE